MPGPRVVDTLAEQCARDPAARLFVVPERVRQLWGLAQAEWSYAEVLAAVEALAQRYRGAGYGAGHRVALALGNRPDHFQHWLALNSLGASVVPVNPELAADEIDYLLAHSESTLAVCLPGTLGRLGPVAAGRGVGVAVVSAPPAAARGMPAAPGGLSAGSPGAATAGAFDPPPARLAPPGNACGEEAECALLYTSGTTGRPKGCILTNGYFAGFGEWYAAQRGYISLTVGRERLLQPLPTFHINAMANSFMGMLHAGGAQVIVDRFHPRLWWAEAVETRATCFHYLGVMPAMLLALPVQPAERAHALRFGMGGGVQPAHHAAFEERFGVRLLEGWAMTETGGGGIVCAMDDPRHVGERCIGRAVRAGPPMELRVVDEHGVPVVPGIPGELQVRSRGADPRRRFFGGYLKDSAATEAAWKRGWLNTGDVVRQAADGSVHFVDRLKNIIRRSGENISAVEVEAVLAAHPRVRQVGVIGVPDPIREQEVMAVVALDPAERGEAELAGVLFEHCAARLAYFKLPGYIVFVSSLPTTATQKVRKAELATLALSPDGNPLGHDLRSRKRQPTAPR